MSESNREVFERWVSDPTTWIGVFENHALDSVNAGHKIALSFDMASFDDAIVGNTRAPDHKAIGTGWKYVLVCKTRDVDEALTALGGTT